jgi:hypothetical protein
MLIIGVRQAATGPVCRQSAATDDLDSTGDGFGILAGGAPPDVLGEVSLDPCVLVGGVRNRSTMDQRAPSRLRCVDQRDAAQLVIVDRHVRAEHRMERAVLIEGADGERRRYPWFDTLRYALPPEVGHALLD